MTTPLGFSLTIALRYLWSRRAEAFITIISIISVLGVAVGVFVLTIVMSVMTGFERELKEKITGTNSHIVVKSLDGRITDWQTYSDRISQISGVASVSPFIQHQALLRAREHATGLLVRGIAADTAAARQLGEYIAAAQGYTSSPADKSEAILFSPAPVVQATSDGSESSVTLPALVVGRELARSAGVYVGQTISLLTPQVTSSPFGLVPRFKRFVVAAIYSSGLIEYESGVAYMALGEAQRFFDDGDQVSGLEVRVSDLDQSSDIAQKIMELPDASKRGLYAQDWKQTNQPLWDALKLEKKVYFLVLLLIIIMASFSIVTTLIMLVLEKRKDIAVLRTLGARARTIWQIFFLQGSIIGGAGTLLGLVGGILGCLALKIYGFPLDERIFQMSRLPIVMEPLNFAAVGVAAFLICCLATIYPAHRAAKLSPSDVLRYE